MKAILPILICSAISAALGYYYRHITLPAEQTAPSAAPSASATSAITSSPAVEPESFANTFEPESVEAAPEPEPELEPEPEPEPEPVVAEEAAPAPTESDFEERANQTIQTLTDTQGRTVNARIIEVTETEVKIRRSDGLETKIPLNMLSPEDVAFSNYLREQQKAEEATVPDTSDGFDWDAYFNS